jgi:protein SCO1/2
LPRYLLRDPQGRAVTIDDFRGRFQLVTFGFVSCPDVCPTTLLEFTQVLKILGDEAKRLQPIFITIDPERDTRDILREYTAAFDARILGLTGSPELVRRAADSFRIEYEKVREPGARPENYTMNHTAGMVLLDTNGRFLARYAYAMPAAEIARRIRAAMDADGGR